MSPPHDAAVQDGMDDLTGVWAKGFSIAELWGFSKPVSRPPSRPDNNHLMLWGILGIIEYQVDHGAGHKYLRERLMNRDWIAIGFPEPKTPESHLTIIAPIENAKFGRRHSSVGDGVINYTDVRIVARSSLMQSPLAHRILERVPSQHTAQAQKQ
jgi:hypothetical protein